jgi:glycosyltransferase involved in cell wall biosynthesis
VGIASKRISKNKIIQISNGCDLELFSNNFEAWPPTITHEKDLKLIYSGTHGIANGLDSVLNAVKVLNERGVSGYKIILIGSGREKQNLIQRSRDEGFANRIIFLDSVSKEKLVGLLKASDVGLQILANVPAFYYGTSPNKFFDYLAVGLPVLTNYPGWVADLIKTNHCGFYCQADNANLFADLIEEIIANRESLKIMSINAKALAKKEFNRSVLSKYWVNWVINGQKYIL